jgi:hypothetical protein
MRALLIAFLLLLVAPPTADAACTEFREHRSTIEVVPAAGGPPRVVAA